MTKDKKRAYYVFWMISVLAVVIVAEVFVPWVNDLLGGSELFLVPLLLFSVGGGILVFFSRRAQWASVWQRRFLSLTGYAAAGFFLFVILHNVFYALGALGFGYTFGLVMEALSVASFVSAIIICPVAYLIGVIGTIWMLPRNVRK